MTRDAELAMIESAIKDGKLSRLPSITLNEAFDRALARTTQQTAKARVNIIWQRPTRRRK